MKFRIIEGVCIVLLVVFMVAITGSMGDSTRSVDDVTAAVLAVTGTDGLLQRQNADFRKAFGQDMSEYEGVVYYTTENIMDVREVLVVKLSAGNDGSVLAEKLTAYAAEKAALFESYEPNCFYLLKNCVIQVKGNFLFFCVNADASAAYEAFRSAL